MIMSDWTAVFKRKRVLYREMKYTRIQMESGVPEIQAYLEFGQRMQLRHYKKFSQLLIQYC